MVYCSVFSKYLWRLLVRHVGYPLLLAQVFLHRFPSLSPRHWYRWCASAILIGVGSDWVALWMKYSEILSRLPGHPCIFRSSDGRAADKCQAPASDFIVKGYYSCCVCSLSLFAHGNQISMMCVASRLTENLKVALMDWSCWFGFSELCCITQKDCLGLMHSAFQFDVQAIRSGPHIGSIRCKHFHGSLP